MDILLNIDIVSDGKAGIFCPSVKNNFQPSAISNQNSISDKNSVRI